MRLKTLTIITMCCLLAVGGAACGNSKQTASDEVMTEDGAGEEQTVTDLATSEEAVTEQTSAEEFVPVEVDERYEYKLFGSSLTGISETPVIGINTTKLMGMV